MAISEKLETLLRLKEVAENTDLDFHEVVTSITEWERLSERDKSAKEVEPKC
ncbi:hypothetical protein BCB4_0167 [Bacillus phage B4]|uniref:Uncharacterized protein n=2 Tax=Bequatrovirus B4 TaxID=1918005 RepID=J9Q9D0_9CAUD|nr:hypothetical protein BCB4_0167 [Bacillus phage B4]YP_009783758.1 hypothetical protein QLX26_gp162 [Bacillus phage B5S]AEW47396.1 hypothetical protein B5S_0162 [Bacillus phage B5S]AEZ65960.1 hypothetical protein BCB4_0167 [Bacillus phage B4]